MVIYKIIIGNPYQRKGFQNELLTATIVIELVDIIQYIKDPWKHMKISVYKYTVCLVKVLSVLLGSFKIIIN